MKTFARLPIFPVLILPEVYPVFDLSQAEDRQLAEQASYGIGKYAEKREQMYSTPLFGGIRNIHMGIDFFAPVKTPVFAFAKGRIHLFGHNSAPGDYGGTIITEHNWGDTRIYALYGHLSRATLEQVYVGQELRGGEQIGWLGDVHENGGWVSHLHFQLSYEKPEVPDLPGVVSEFDFEAAQRKYPDPRIILGPIYVESCTSLKI